TYTTNAGGSFTPAIGLLDRPARRVAWFTGPTITETTREKSLSTLSATFTAPSQWWGGYSANYRVTNRGQQATSWELSFFLSAPARVEDVWGAGQLKRPTERQHRGGKPGQPTDPPLALYANPQMAGTPVAAAVSADVSAEAGSGGAGGAGATTAYVIKCTQPLPPGASVDVGFRVESGQQNTPMPGHCSINGSPCAGTGPTPPEPDKDTQPPSRPTDVTVTHAGPRTIGLSWTEATDDTAVRKYEIAVDGDVTVEVPAPATGGTVTRLNPHTQYQLTVRAVDAAGNTGLWSDPVTGLTTEDTPQADKPWLARVAPFVDMGLWPTPQLAEFAAESGLNAFNLGFIVALENTDPTPVWAGQATYAVKDGWQKDNIVGFGAGGTRHAVISFGGETGTELAIAAKDTETAYQQYKLVIDTYGFGDGPHHIDFDIEGAAQKNQAANERRAAAVARLQREYPDLRVSWTLPVLPEGLVPDGLNVLRTAQAAGVRIDLVNIMAMVFYRQEDMGQLVRSAMENTHRQLAEFFPGVTAKERWAKLSVCPMIGMNNDRAIYSLDHAKQTTDFAIERGLGQTTYWEAGRDRNACLSEALFQCTAIPQQPWDFARRFIAYQNTAVKKAPAGKAGD
ncbi:MAG: fibronectin type III domain-containing protein, partial [Nocardiopsaceae bacterium]|nr:fibronectin type III domain-containing protein [Nocardiopsaceae bacterium]